MGNDVYTVTEVDEENKQDWIELYVNSKQHTIFMRDDYLDLVGYEAKKYMVYRKKRAIAGLCIPICKETGGSSFIVPYAPYQGLLFAKSNDEYHDYRINLDAVSVLMDYLYEGTDFDSIGFSNTVYVKDMRGIQWHHYHKPELGMYDINMRYTCSIELDDSFHVQQRMSKGRKLDYRYSEERYGLTYNKSSDIAPFLELYYKTFARQGIGLKNECLDQVTGLVKHLLNSGEGELYYAVEQSGKYIDSTFIVYDIDQAYYLFGANDPEYRKYGGGTLLLVEQIKRMSDRGVHNFDFIGINSPQRGDYKLSFGGKVIPYYTCSVNYR